MFTINDVHQQFAENFSPAAFRPYAYLVSKKLQEGNICVQVKPLEPGVLEEIPEGYKMVLQPLAQNSHMPVASADGTVQPFILHNGNLYLQRYFAYETSVLERLKAFVLMEENNKSERGAALLKQKDLVHQLFSTPMKTKAKNTDVDWQLVAAISAVLNYFTIITGGPGTGKTTTVAKILALLYSIDQGLKVTLAAPTGKAAVRMADSLRQAAGSLPAEVKNNFETLVPATLHRLLGFLPGSTGFKHNSQNPLPFDVVIVDESSMIDVALFAKLLQAVGPDTRLILLGDKDQLASVEAGSLFGDICNTVPESRFSQERLSFINQFIPANETQLPKQYAGEKDQLLFEHIIALQKSHRFASDKGIGKLSRAVILNQVQEVEGFISTIDPQVIIDTAYDEARFNQFVALYRGYIKEKDIAGALTKFAQVRVLCAVRDGEQGLYALNQRIERYLEQKKWINTATEFYENRPIIITKNYYDLCLFNGDTGIIRTGEDNVIKAWFLDSEGHPKWVLPGFLIEAETVFAMTVHKSQGSEYDNVLVTLPDTPDLPLLTSELLYTAITRTKTHLTLQASTAVLKATIGKRVKRASGIVARLLNKSFTTE